MTSELFDKIHEEAKKVTMAEEVKETETEQIADEEKQTEEKQEQVSEDDAELAGMLPAEFLQKKFKQANEVTNEVVAYAKKLGFPAVNAFEESLLSFLKTWFIQHILGIDSKYVQFFTEREIEPSIEFE